MTMDLIQILVCVIAIGYGSSWLVDSAAKIAKKFNISELVIGLTVVAFGTSAPEFAVSISAAATGHSNISVGNIVGSNIFNLGFILGGCALLMPLKTSPLAVKRDGTFLLGGTLLLCVFFSGTSPDILERWEGAILFSLLAVYLVFLYIKRADVDMDEIPAEEATGMDGFYLLMGLLFVVGGAHFMVEAAIRIAEAIGVSDWIISVTIVAAGTSLPEVATSFTAVIKGRHGISAGNLIGSDIFNMYGVLGLAGMILPLEVTGASFVYLGGIKLNASLFALVGMVVLTLIFMRTDWTVSRFEGSLLVLVALVRWGYDLKDAIFPYLGLAVVQLPNGVIWLCTSPALEWSWWSRHLLLL